MKRWQRWRQLAQFGYPISKIGVELMDTFLDFSLLFLTEDRALHPLVVG